jgi:hypothetical protein
MAQACHGGLQTASGDTMRCMSKFVVHHIPVCPFSQRLKILRALKGLPDEWMLKLTRGTTA